MLDLERYAKRIGALSDMELRVQRDQEADEDFEERKLHRHKVVVNDADDEDDWD